MKLLHLYYDLMNLYGEYGNIVVLKKHLEDQGFEVTVDKKSIYDDINFEDYDFIYCGSGTESNQKIVLNDLMIRKDEFIKAYNSNTVILFTGNAMELLGISLDDIEALRIAPIKTKTTNKRYTGDVIVSNTKLGELVGFINKCSIIEQQEENKLFDYVFKDTNIIDNNYEGYHLNNLFGTHLIGPILVKNPNMMKEIVTLLGLRKNPSFIYKTINYKYEEDSYNTTLNALKERIK